MLTAMGGSKNDLEASIARLKACVDALHDVAHRGYPRGDTLACIRDIAIQSYDLLEKYHRSQRCRRWIKLACIEVARHVQIAGVRWGVSNGRHQP